MRFRGREESLSRRHAVPLYPGKLSVFSLLYCSQKTSCAWCTWCALFFVPLLFDCCSPLWMNKGIAAILAASTCFCSLVNKAVQSVHIGQLFVRQRQWEECIVYSLPLNTYFWLVVDVVPFGSCRNCSSAQLDTRCVGVIARGFGRQSFSESTALIPGLCSKQRDLCNCKVEVERCRVLFCV